MRKRHFIYAVTLVLVTGCNTKLSTPEQGMISFGADAVLEYEEGTKAVAKENFVTGDAFSVFGKHASSKVFDNIPVTLQSSGKWTYSPPQEWDWNGNGSDTYEFVAVYPSGNASWHLGASENVATRTTYNIQTDNYDLMGAAYKRQGSHPNPTSVVELKFQHLTSAVRVEVENKSETLGVDSFTYRFKNLIVSSTAKVAHDVSGPVIDWISPTTKSNAEVRPTTYSTRLAPADKHTCEWDLLIPQALNEVVGSITEDNMPRLLFTYYYTPSGGSQVSTTASILLKDVERMDGTKIGCWEKGVKYTYHISVRLDGGLLVRLITTQWDEIDAETPGLLLE